MGALRHHGWGLALILAGAACKKEPSQPGQPVAAKAAKAKAKANDPDQKISYDIRRLRPSSQELDPWFAKLLAQTIQDGKRPAVLFSAGWCHACQDVEQELGNTHPRRQIGHVRIFELIEEDWEAVTRLDEYNDFRSRWHPELGTYPMLFLLDAKGDKVESMQEAKERLQAANRPANFPTWFEDVGPLSASGPS